MAVILQNRQDSPAGLMKARINKLLKPLGVTLAERDDRPYWPRGRGRRIDRCFLFLLTPPSSGSADMARYLTLRGEIGGLHPSFEGQRLIRGLMDADRWWPEKFIDYEAVIGAWDRQIEELDPNGRYAFWLEKSPPNLVRYQQLLEYFPERRVVVSNRAPMANVASQLRRYLYREYHGARRALVVRHLARLWLWRSERLMSAAVRGGFPCVPYERFCSGPNVILDAFGLPPLDLRMEAAHRIADPAGDHAHTLSDQEREIVARELVEAGEVLAFFGYDIATELAGELAGDVQEGDPGSTKTQGIPPQVADETRTGEGQA